MITADENYINEVAERFGATVTTTGAGMLSVDLGEDGTICHFFATVAEVKRFLQAVESGEYVPEF